MHGVISTGKEANVYRGEDSDGNPVAVKIYRVSTAETDFMLEYIVGDPRFKRIKKRSRALIPQWALKEYKNLTRYHEAGVRVPKPLDIQRNVLVMEFIGDPKSSISAPMIKNVEIPEFLEHLGIEKMAMEASTYIIPMYRRLTEQGYNVTVSHPKKTRYIAEARIKSDRVDSKALAELLRLNSLP